MNIAVLRPQVPFARGGAEIFTDRLVDELRARGHEADLVSVPFKWYPGARVLTQAFLWRLLDLEEADGKRIDVGPGQALCIPRGAVHRFDTNGTEDVKALCVITPAAIGPQYFREVAEVIDAAIDGPADRAKLKEIMLRHGLAPAPPPPAA